MTEIQATIMVLRVMVVFLIALFCLLCIHFPRIEFFRWWTAAWAVFGVHLACGAMLEASGSRGWLVAQLVAGYIQSPLLAIGARRYQVPERRTSTRSGFLAIFGAALSAFLFYGLSTAQTEPYASVVQNIPRKALLGCALGYCTWVCLRRAHGTRSWSASAIAAAFAISALSEFGTSIDWVRDVYQISLPGFLFEITRTTAKHQLMLGLMWSLGASLGMILLLLEEHRRTERAEEENRKGRQELERNFAKAVRASLDPITISDLETGRYVEANDAFLRLAGYSREEVIGRTSLELGVWELPQDRETFASQLREGGALQNFEVRLRKRNGSTAFLIASADLLDVQGRPHVLSMGKDLTDRKRAEEELRSSEARFRQLAGDLKQFAYIASHTLQEPVKNVSVFAEMLARHHADQLSAEGMDCVRTVVESAQHIRSLVRDLLDYTRAGELGRASCNVTDTNEIVNEVLYSLQASVQECGAVIVSDELPALRASRVHLRQLFQNLLENAIKYRAETPPRIEIRTARIDDHWRISICDNGIGIERQYWDQIFGLFRRLHGGEHPGTGIGLALCRKIVETYGGRIWVESDPGRGSTFVFTLPDRHSEEDLAARSDP